MVDIVLIEGILGAIRRRESLRDAMMSFYNAGYEKSEIEKSAREVQKIIQNRGIITELQYPLAQKKPPLGKKVIPPPKKEFGRMQRPIQRVSAYGEDKESIKKIKEGINSAINELNRIEFPNGKGNGGQISKKGVSSYGEKPRKKTAIIVLSVILFLLLSTLAGIFVFKENVLDFFDKSGFFSGIFG